MAIDEVLERAATDALRGAEDLKKRLALETATGTPSLSDLAYAIKIRIKEDYKIVDKVIDRRTNKEKPAYEVGDIRDIVGLRIVTLYRLDALRILPLLLDRLQPPEGSETSVFKPGGIEEVKIYSPNPKGDAQGLPNRLKQLFASRGLEAEMDQQASNYSSVHIVTWGRGKYRDAYRDIPIEIQVRTAFEDAWSEIEHALKYKRRKSGVAGDVATENRLQIGHAHLTVLKTLVDGIAQYSDQIKLQIDEVDGERDRPAPSRPAEDAGARLSKIKNLPDTLMALISKAITAARPALSPAESLTKPERLKILQRAVEMFEEVRPELAAAKLPADTAKETHFVVMMEYALVLFELGTILGGSSQPLVDAANIYSDLESAFPNRLVITYRLARTLAALGDRPTAIVKLRSFIQTLEAKPSLLPKKHWLRAAAPRVLGYLMWEEATYQRKLRRDPEKGSAAELALLSEAYALTKQAAEIAEAIGPSGVADRDEVAKSANNFLYYLLEFQNAGGDPATLDPEWGAERVRSLLLMIGVGTDPEAVSDPRFTDTAAVAFQWLGEPELADAYARRTVVLETV